MSLLDETPLRKFGPSRLDSPPGLARENAMQSQERKIRNEAQIIKKSQTDMRLARRMYRQGVRNKDPRMIGAGLQGMNMFQKDDTAGIMDAGANVNAVRRRDSLLTNQANQFNGEQESLLTGMAREFNQREEDRAYFAPPNALDNTMESVLGKAKAVPQMLRRDTSSLLIDQADRTNSPIDRMAADLSRSKLIADRDPAAMERAFARAGTLGLKRRDVLGFVSRLRDNL